MPRPACKFFAIGQCTRGDQCTFTHPNQQSQSPNNIGSNAGSSSSAGEAASTDNCSNRRRNIQNKRAKATALISRCPTPSEAECASTSSNKWVTTCGRLAQGGRSLSVQRMMSECFVYMSPDSKMKEEQHVSVVNNFQARQMDMQAAGLNVNRKARDLTTGTVSETKRAAIIANNRRALSFILTVSSAGSQLTVGCLLDAHGMLMGTPGASKLRQTNVRVGTIHFAGYQHVPRLMDQLVKDFASMEQDASYSPFARAAWLMYTLLQIHPFADGNGRLGRLLVNFVLHRKSVTWCPPPQLLQQQQQQQLESAHETAISDTSIPFVISFVNSRSQREAYIGGIKHARRDVHSAHFPDVSVLATLILTSVYHSFCILSGMISADAMAADDDEDDDEMEAVAATAVDVVVPPPEPEPESNCVICLEGHVQLTTSCCRHAYHLQCLYRWSQTNPSCPICRTNIAPPQRQQQDENDNDDDFETTTADA